MAPADYGTQLHTVDWVLVSSSAIFLGLRIYCKKWRHRGLWWDDYILVAAWISLLIEVIFTTIRIKLGFGQHIEFVERQVLPSIYLLGKVSSTFSICAIVLSKTSFSLTLLRITSGYVRHFIWFVIVSMNVTMSLNLVTVWLSCADEGCDSAGLGYNIFSSAYSAFLDLALTLLPWKLLWGLSILNKERFGIILAMSMGVFAAFTAIMKCLKLPHIYRDRDDPTYKSSELVLWRTAEAATTIMAASIPILRVLIRDVTSPDNRFYASYNRRMAAHRGQPTDEGPLASMEQPNNHSFILTYRSDSGMLDASGSPISSPATRGAGSPPPPMPPLPTILPPLPGSKSSEVRIDYGYRGHRYPPDSSNESLPGGGGSAYGFSRSGRKSGRSAAGDGDGDGDDDDDDDHAEKVGRAL